MTVAALILEKTPVWVPVEVNVRVSATELYAKVAVKGSIASGVLTVKEVKGTDKTETAVVQLSQFEAVVIVAPEMVPTVNVMVDAPPGKADKNSRANAPRPEL